MLAKRKLEPAGLICLLLVLLILAVYLPVVGFDFTNYDDPDYVTKNPPVQAGLKWDGVCWAFTHSHSANWHPLTWLSHMADCEVYGMRPGGHHLTNLLLHTANTLLLFLWLRSMTGALWRSGMVAALFALHPMHVESVAWIAERKDVLSAFFGLLALWAYGNYAKARVPGLGSKARELHVSRYYILALVFLALGLMSKPMLVTLPFVMLLLDYWPLRRFGFCHAHPQEIRSEKAASGDEQSEGEQGRPASIVARERLRRVVLEKIPFFALAAASSLVTVFVQRAVDALAPLELTPLRARVINALVCYFLYLRKLVWPSHLAVLYPEVNHWPLAQIVLAAAVLGVLSVVVLRQRRERPWLLTGWAWFLGMLVPVIGLVKVGSHLIADRYTYLPAIGLFIILAWGAAEFAGSSVRRRALVGTAMAAVLAACAVAAAAQVLFWRNTQTLFRRALAVTTSNYVAYTSLAFDFAEHKRPDQAEQCLRASLEINPAFEPAWTKLATVLVDQGRVDEAIDDCHRALRLDPRSVAAHSILGLALLQQGQTNEAIMHYSEALRYRPEFADAHYNLANVLAHQGDFEKATEHYRAALRSEPDSADAHNNLAYMLVREGKLAEAVPEFRAALRLQPDSWSARYGLGDALVRQGQFQEGAWELSQVLRAQPELASARLQFGVAQAAQGKLDEAAAAFSEVLRQKPELVLARYHLAVVLSRQGKIKEALPHYREVMRLRPNFAEALNALAWLLATNPDAGIRDGAEAIQLAERACVLTAYKQPLMMETLAAAYAEAGRIADAVSTAEKACTMVADAKDAARCLELLSAFKAGRPYRS